MKKKGFTLGVYTSHYETLKMLHEGFTITEISKHRKVSRQAVYKTIKVLNKHGLLRHPKANFYEVTEKGIRGLHSLVGLRYNLRQHNLHFKIKVLESPKNWELKRNEIRFLPFYNKTLKLNNNEQELFNFGKIQVKTTSKSVIMKIPTIYAKDWEHAVIQAMGILEDNIYKIERVFKIRLVKDYKANITIVSQEYARIQDVLAKLYRREGNRLYLTGEDNKIWLITDFSFSTDELEFIHPNKATDDLDAIAPMLNDLRKNPTTFTEVRTEIGELQGVVEGVLHNEVKHQKVLDQILTEFRDFKQWRQKNGYS